MIALGERASAIFSMDEDLEKLLRELGEKSGDYVWPWLLGGPCPSGGAGWSGFFLNGCFWPCILCLVKVMLLRLLLTGLTINDLLGHLVNKLRSDFE